MMGMAKRNTAEKLRIFKGLFMGLRNVYGTYDTQTGRVRQEKAPVTDKVILAHLRGKQSYGVYLLMGDKTCALAVDFDDGRLSLPVSFVAQAKEYGLSAYIERSKSKGYHVWLFFKGPLPAYKTRIVAKKILEEMGQSSTEIFPKQDALSNGIAYGNFINAPLFGTLVPKGKTVFVDPHNPAIPHLNQWELLEKVQRISEHKLDKIVENCKFSEPQPIDKKIQSNNHTDSNCEVSPFGLPPCARRMLAEGVVAFQRVSCFRLAVHLKRYGMPYDLTLITLKAWAQKNRPIEGKRIITDQEITYQVKCAFENSYRSFGCEDPAMAEYCSANCPLYEHTIGKTSSRTKDIGT